MAADYITEQMEEEYRQGMYDFIAEKAAILIVTSQYSRESAVQHVKNVIEFQQSHLDDPGLYIVDEQGYPIEWLVPEAQFPRMPTGAHLQNQIKAVAQQIRYMID
ncbi:hypothetical protein ACM36D_000879 [Cronobacter sakazakii]